MLTKWLPIQTTSTSQPVSGRAEAQALVDKMAAYPDDIQPASSRAEVKALADEMAAYPNNVLIPASVR